MKRLALFAALLLAPSIAFCDRPVQDSAQDQAKGDSNGKIQDNLQSVLSGDPILSGADVQAVVDDQNITLTGTVESYAQHQRVLQLVEPYARTRKVVDKIRMPNSQSKYASARFSAAWAG
ncbi:MAG TPA: BON domain-containing protein [Candidatus Angelobacter sp.]|nr:BON domain-containing protein [Candidatus Angelobacter sp.]